MVPHFQYVTNQSGGAGAFFFYGTKYFPFHGWSISLSPKRQKRKKERKKKRKGRLATMFSAAASCLPTSRSGSQPVHHEASHPASKQANRSISFSGATGTGPSNATKQRATVLHHFPSERPSRPQPLITRHCQSAEHQEPRRTAHFTALSLYTTVILNLYPAGGFYFSFQQRPRRGQHKKENKWNPSNSIFNWASSCSHSFCASDAPKGSNVCKVQRNNLGFRVRVVILRSATEGETFLNALIVLFCVTVILLFSFCRSQAMKVWNLNGQLCSLVSISIQPV